MSLDRKGKHQIALVSQQILIKPLNNDDQRNDKGGDDHHDVHDRHDGGKGRNRHIAGLEEVQLHKQPVDHANSSIAPLMGRSIRLVALNSYFINFPSI